MRNECPPAAPQWLESRDKHGLDPLGMHNSSIQTYQSLLPGISNVTQRLRYYSLYAWLSCHYAKEIGDTNSEIWRHFLRRAEALYALAAVTNQDRVGVAGSRWAAKFLAASAGRNIDFQVAAREQYLANAWGAYGAAYGSQLLEVGIFNHAKEHEIEVASPEVGEDLGKAFSNAAGTAGDKFLRVIERGVTSARHLESFKPMMPSSIVSQSREHKLAQRILFASLDGARDSDLQRRRTMLLLLDLAEATNRVPSEWQWRWSAYSGLIGPHRRWRLPAELERHRLQWRLYQANELCHVSYSVLLRMILDRLSDHPYGVVLDQLIGDVVKDLTRTLIIRPRTWNDWVSRCVQSVEPIASTRDSERSLTEFLLDDGAEGSEAGSAALSLLAAVQRRTIDIRGEIETRFAGSLSGGSRSLLSELRFFEHVGEEPFSDTLSRLLSERIVQRHVWVAVRKLRHQGDYTFLLEPDEGRIRLRHLYDPVVTAPRFGPTISFLRDLRLLDDQGITKSGTRLLEEGA